MVGCVCFVRAAIRRGVSRTADDRKRERGNVVRRTTVLIGWTFLESEVWRRRSCVGAFRAGAGTLRRASAGRRRRSLSMPLGLSRRRSASGRGGVTQAHTAEPFGVRVDPVTLEPHCSASSRASTKPTFAGAGETTSARCSATASISLMSNTRRPPRCVASSTISRAIRGADVMRR